MLAEIPTSLVEWSRGQFALTAFYHWLFVPITIGLAFIMAIMETIYFKAGNEEWKKITKFWMKLFGINFAIGVATGLIMEFEFGTNWSNYSWFVGDIFGAPLAIEGIMAFFLESTFIAVMFFGWNRVSKKFHLVSTWLVAVGASLSALWILVANAWMQYPVGMQFNPDTARSEMLHFWDVLLSPVAVNKWLHTVTACYVIGALFVAAVSGWYLLKRRETALSRKSLVVSSIFGLIMAVFLAFTGDGSAYTVAQKQPVKLAAMEGLYKGKEGAGLVFVGILNPRKKTGDTADAFLTKVEIPKLLSILGYRSSGAYVPGLDDLVYGNSDRGIISTEEKIITGKNAIKSLKGYKKAKKAGDNSSAKLHLAEFKSNQKHMGYGYLSDPEKVVPNVPLIFYSFHIMVGLGFWFILLFALLLFFTLKGKIDRKRVLLILAIITFPLGFLASQGGWIVAEVGRQPWAIQDLLPVSVATSNINTSSVQLTFWLFAALFTVLLLAEIKIMITAIRNGSKDL